MGIYLEIKQMNILYFLFVLGIGCIITRSTQLERNIHCSISNRCCSRLNRVFNIFIITRFVSLLKSNTIFIYFCFRNFIDWNASLIIMINVWMLMLILIFSYVLHLYAFIHMCIHRGAFKWWVKTKNKQTNKQNLVRPN